MAIFPRIIGDGSKKISKQADIGAIQNSSPKKGKKILTAKKYNDEALRLPQNVQWSQKMLKLSCALLWWCEGNKHSSFVRFTNSDSTLIANFISMLRNCFPIDESKFRILVHLHKYHDDETQKNIGVR